MRLSSLVFGALGALTALPVLSSTITVSDVMQRALTGYADNARRDIVSTILTDIEHAAECTACEALLVVLKVLADFGDEAFVKVIVAICQDLKVEDADVCAGAIGLEGPILAQDLRGMTIGTKTSQLFCLTIFGLCPWPEVNTAGAPALPAKPDTLRPSSSGKTPLKVVHISDIHVDLSYETGASWNCTKNICCRPYTAADAPGNTDTPCGPNGNTHCDSPLTLEESMYSAIESLVPDRNFTIFTGDVVEGAVWLVSETEVINDLNDAYSRMKSLGTVYAVTGNHDSSPVNSFLPMDLSGKKDTISTQWVYDTLASAWQTWIGSAAASEVSSHFGSYSVMHPGGLRVISVNTNFWYKQNFWMYEATMETDPSGMFAWLVSELQAAETAGQRVWLMGHMPMGASDAFHDASYYFDTIVQRYDATIAAIFYGHTHKDEFEIAYSDYTAQSAKTATMMSYIAPALTPTSGNPTFRVYEVDPVTFGVLDYTVYYANISSPSYQNSGPTWSALYSAKELYGSALGVTDPTAELTPAFWHNVTALFESNDSLFQTYIGLKSRNYNTAACSGSCKTSEICQLRAAQAQYNCAIVKPGVNFKRGVTSTSSGVHTTAGECDGSEALPILSSIPGSSGIQALRDAMMGVLGSDILNTTVPSNYTVNGTKYWN